MGYSLGDLTLHLTEACNLGCRYCFQGRRSHILGFPSIKRALEFFQDAFEPRSFVGFYGGEPLLEFETIRRTVSYIRAHNPLRGKKLRYSISTNGTLLTNEVMSFLDTHKFLVNLSHDGTAQETTRPSRLNSFILENLDRLIRLKGINLETNSVFVPSTAGEIFNSARFLVERGVKNCRLTYSIIDPWDPVSLRRLREQVRELRKFLLSYYRRNYSIPIENFHHRPIRSMFWCSAGQDRFALAADGRLWGCRFFADFFADKAGHPEFSKYSFGEFQEFVRQPPNGNSAIYKNYLLLRQDGFSSDHKACQECKDLLFCASCPATVAFLTGAIGKIPAWKCDLNKVWRDEVRKFWREAGKS